MTPLVDRTASALRALATPVGHARAANALLGVAVLTFAVASWRAIHLDPLPTAAPDAPAMARTTLGDESRLTRVQATDAAALDNDPFRFDRLLPESESGAAPVMSVIDAADPPVAPETVRLLGTVVLPGERSFVIYQLPSQVPRSLRIGESVGRLRLETVVPGRAGFRAADGARVELQLPRPGS